MKLNKDIALKVQYYSKKLTRNLFMGLGIVFLIQLLLSFTTLPFWMYYNLGANEGKFCGNPDYIIVLGGGGMPSESGLMRTYQAAKISKQFLNAAIIIALPGDTLDHESSVYLMRQELCIRGVDSLRVYYENVGTNTRMQALNIAKKISHESKVIIVTSPDHMFRACKSFQKAGLKYSCGKPAYEQAIEASLDLTDDLGGNNYLASIGKSKQFRYQFWNHIKYQNLVYREYMAITYYKIRGWI